MTSPNCKIQCFQLKTTRKKWTYAKHGRRKVQQKVLKILPTQMNCNATKKQNYENIS